MPAGSSRTSILRGSRGGALGLTIETKGFRDLGRALAQADPEVRRAFFREMNEAVGPALARAKGAAPRRSGRLASSIKVRRIGVGARGTLRIGVGSTLIYAPVLEFAARGRYRSLTAKWGPPPRYLIPSVEGEADAIAARVEPAVQRTIDRLLNKQFGGD